ncbi:uncharacterized protein [Miscanthus floridulus]|uniref:uncharacterized protein isoform X2 n=1 Tax=Miscanthus floridulus TaxID=154761 RepID=UPI00345A1A8F
MLTRSSSRQARDIADQGSNPEGEITVQKCEEILSQESLSFMDKVKASSISDEDYEDLVTISESMAKKITDQETYLKGAMRQMKIKVQVIAWMVTKKQVLCGSPTSCKHLQEVCQFSREVCLYVFLKVGARSAATSPSPSRHRQATGEEELLREDISSLQMIEPFSFIVACDAARSVTMLNS